MKRIKTWLSWRCYRGWALLSLLTVAVTWLWAHEGHAPLPTKGVVVEGNKLFLTPPARAVLGLTVKNLEKRVIEDKVLAYATLVSPWQRHAFVSTRLPGRIAKILVQPGQTISAGATLAEVNSLELEDLQLDILNAENARALSAKVVEQVGPLVKSGAIPEREYREAAFKHKQDLNALEIARAKWLSLGLGEEKWGQLLKEKNPQLVATLPISSPIGGTVIHADLSLGRVVEPTEHLFEIVDLTSVWVKVGVLETDLHKIQVGQSIELRLAAYPNEVQTVQVQVKSLYLDAITHLGTAWGELLNPAGKPARFLPGMHGQAYMVLSSAKPVLAAPSAAVAVEGAERYVLVQTANTDKGQGFERRAVVVGLSNEEWTEIRGGEVFLEDLVVTMGLHELAGLFIPGVLRLSPEAVRNIELRLATVQPHSVEEVLEIQGTVEVPPDRRAFASAQLAGKISTIAIERNQPVKRGDVVAEVASLDLQKLQLDLLQVHLQLALLKETLERLRDAETVVAQRRLWDTESQYSEAVNRQASLKRKLESVGLSSTQIDELLKNKRLVETLPVRAPRNGVVVHFDKVLGQVIKAEEPLFEIHDLSQTYVQAFLSEREVGLVRPGQKVRVRLVADPAFVEDGTVVRSGQVFGVESRVLSVWIEQAHKPVQPLQHNLLAQVSVLLGQSIETLAVPLTAVVREGTRTYVFVLGEAGRNPTFERRLIEIGRADDRYVEIVSGLRLGESVAVHGTRSLQTAYAGVR
ncbi:MAG: efflux RND transporter periplasmic adaptor subunit [Planctomycetes bacterium]|nr:efflux RND transporter periplasmic adaptor subunit [Planctomycetota bacterium]